MPKKLKPVAELSFDTGVQKLIEVARDSNIQTAFDRSTEMGTRCTFGELGVCCKRCLQGPCRIIPSKKEHQRGVCGATADSIVARNFLTLVAEGVTPHVEHAREVAITLLEASEGKAPYEIANPDKLFSIAESLDLTIDGKDVNEVGREVALKALENFQQQFGTLPWLLQRKVNPKTMARWEELGILPTNGHMDVVMAVNKQAMGCDADPANLLLGAMKLGLVDGYAGLTLSTDLQDILFGTPSVVKSEYRLAVIKEDMVNISVHGHVPMIAEKVVEWADKLEDQAKALGAKGINIFGVCCSGNEVLMRRGIPVASNYSSQELAIVTGAVEGMVVDVQCIMPSLPKVAECFHTEIFTTLPYVKIPGATHVEFSPENADDCAKTIVEKSIENYKKRDASRINIPVGTVEAYAGFSTEQIIEALKQVNSTDPLKPLVDSIVSGDILGVVGLVGCTNPKTKQDWANVELTKELLKNNVLVVATGCSAHSLAKFSLMSPDGLEYCGESLKNVLTAIGQANGLPSLPPVLHMGSCVDNSRIADLCAAVADYLDVEVKDLPVAGSSPEIQSPKALAIGSFFIAQGVDVHIGIMPPIAGSELVTNVLTKEADQFELTTDGLFGGKIIYEPNPYLGAQEIIGRLLQKRTKLGLENPPLDFTQVAATIEQE